MTDGFLIDSNTFRLYGEGHPAVRAAVTAHVELVYLSSVTVEEMIVGRISLINRVRSGKSGILLADAYAALDALIMDICPFPRHLYSEAAEAIYQRFPASIRRVGAQDCRIAAQAIAHGMTVVTRNTRDFDAIGAPCVDWSV